MTDRRRYFRDGDGARWRVYPDGRVEIRYPGEHEPWTEWTQSPSTLAWLLEHTEITEDPPGSVDDLAVQVIDEHLLTGPRPGQCRCGFGSAEQPFSARDLGKPHSAHLVEHLRAAGVLK